MKERKRKSTNIFLLSLKAGWSKLHICSNNQCQMDN